MNVRISLVASLISAVLLAACSSDEDLGPGPDNANTSRKLKTLENSDTFLDALRAGLIAQVSDANSYPEPVVDSDSSPVSAEGASDSDASDGGGSTASPDDSGNEVTSTNVQELGVDEQDWVKLSGNGERLYVLESAYSGYGFPSIEFDEIPPPDSIGMTSDEDPGDSPIEAPEGYQTTLRILQLDADAPDAVSLRDFPVPLEGGYAEGFYLYETEDKAQAVLTSNSNNYWAYWSESYSFGDQSSVITRVDVTDPDNASITGSLTVDGQIVSSRRIGKYLFFASRFYPTIPGVQPYDQTPEAWQAAVNNADVTDLLPQYQLDGSDVQTALIDPAECFVSEAASNNDYYSPDIITLAVLDLDTLQFSDSECYLGASETLYASPNAVFLATTQYDYSVGPIAEDGSVVDVEQDVFPIDFIWSDPRVDTDIHQFDIDGGQLVYTGSGTVPGHLGWNELRKPFRMSEKDGYLRVATMNDRQGLEESPILMTVLKADGNGELKTVSTLPNSSQPAFIGKPGEQLFASRFLGDRSYLVTFRQTDPLYVLDLADPENPLLAGELQINGYSDYLHPIDENYLLGIGRDADPASGAELGIKLSLFDVSNPASPSEIQSVLVGQTGTHSSALYDHRAITVQSATEQHPTRVSFGINVNGQALPSSSATGNDVFSYYDWTYTGLHGFDISTGTDAGITFRGAMVVESAANDDGYFYPSYVNDRSVMVNDSLFYIHGTRVYAAPWNDLANPTPAR
ncbi:beta-propeller domain-containing protein [Granulosicoccus antarcticus]|uniref:Beta propeller domain-containing protein n=1 Tax=Granulosicoccus antarcticus IMCC3135 TaxID=1192854 RepID=A0A2Z2NLC7_9GAMM|nr:beta-propeller domain-containing protein [Granulosicoccus antarcticus]ASJ71335.1 hypothetical protein IMCC3135_06115 [Granulosicoccus antarcticus IMCC3135]